MKRLLYITAFPPNRRSGGQVFSLNAIKDLSKKYVVDLIFFNYPNHEQEAIENVKLINSYTPSFFGCFQCVSFHPVFTRRFSFSILNKIIEIKDKYDVLYFDYIQTAIYSIFINHPRKIIRCHDILWEKYSREGNILIDWIANGEKKILDSAAMVLVPSKKDSECVKKKYKIDALYTSEYLDEFAIPKTTIISNKFILFGLWSRYENIEGLKWFVEHVYIPNSDELKGKMVVMGGGMEKKIINNYIVNNGIEYLGYIDDCYSEIVKYAAMIVPLFHGAGIKRKVLDSFNTGTPVIGTKLAFEGLNYIKGLVYCNNSAEEFIKCIKEFSIPTIEMKEKFKNDFEEHYTGNYVSDYL